MIIERTKNTEIDCKRLYLPFKITERCPKCEKDSVIDLDGQHHLSYPTVGDLQSIYFYCRYCEHGWTRQVILDVTLTPVQEPA